MMSLVKISRLESEIIAINLKKEGYIEMEKAIEMKLGGILTSLSSNGAGKTIMTYCCHI